MAFRVTEIINANTIKISPRWAWEGYAGEFIKIKNFNTTSVDVSNFIKTKLSNLLLNKEVELKNPTNATKGANNNDEITVNVYLNGVDISVYFPEMRSVA
jgi:hypothetical protein